MAQAPIPAQPYYPQVDKSVDPKVTTHFQRIYPALNDHDKAIRNISGQITSLAEALNYTVSGNSVTKSSTTTASSTGVTPAQAQSIAAAVAQTQFPISLAAALGSVDNDTTTAFNLNSHNYGGIVTLNNAAPIVVTLNPTVASQFFVAFENLGAGTATLTPGTGVGGTGLINGLANIALTTGQGALVYWDGTNWWALPVMTAAGGGVASLNGLIGALTLTSTGGTITITPSGSTINLEAAAGAFLPTNNPTFTGKLTGPHYVGNGAIGSISAGAGTGTGPSVTINTANDVRGDFSVTTGTGPIGVGSIADIVFAVAYASLPVIVISPTGTNAAGGQPYVAGASPTGFSISFNGSTSPTTAYSFTYHVIG